jgi:hypothetical protein
MPFFRELLLRELFRVVKLSHFLLVLFFLPYKGLSALFSLSLFLPDHELLLPTELLLLSAQLLVMSANFFLTFSLFDSSELLLPAGFLLLAFLLLLPSDFLLFPYLFLSFKRLLPLPVFLTGPRAQPLLPQDLIVERLSILPN